MLFRFASSFIQVVRSAHLWTPDFSQLKQKKSSAVAISYHPGTTKTPLSSPFISPTAPSKPSEGLFEPEEAVEKLVAVLAGLKSGLESDGGDSGGFRDWKGEKVPW